jgi:ketosteroid isomerase-like protein
MADSSADIIRSGYEAFGRGDVPAVLAMFADDISWHVGGRNPLAGVYTGHDEVLGFFGQLGERSGGTFHLVLDDVFDNGAETVAALVTETAEYNGKQLDETWIHLWRVRDGKATRFQGYAADDHANDEFWN